MSMACTPFGRGTHLPALECVDVAGLVGPLFALMFLLSKLLPLLLLPLGIALLLLIWGSARGSRWPVMSAIAVLWIFSTPLTAEQLWRGPVSSSMPIAFLQVLRLMPSSTCRIRRCD